MKTLKLFFCTFLAVLALAIMVQNTAFAKKEKKSSQKPKGGESSTFGISPPSFELMCKSGEKKTLNVKLTNPTNQPENLQLIPSGMILNGSETPMQQGTAALPSNNLGRHIIIESPSFVVPPRSYKNVSVALDIPQGLTGTQYVSIIATNVTGASLPEGVERPEEYKSNVSIGINPGIAIMIKCNMEGTLKYGYSLKNMRVQPAQGNEPMNLIASIQNTGNAELLFFPVIILMDSANKPVARLKPSANGLLVPGSTKDITFSSVFAKVPPGSYKAILNLASQQTQLSPSEKMISVR